MACKLLKLEELLSKDVSRLRETVVLFWRVVRLVRVEFLGLQIGHIEEGSFASVDDVWWLVIGRISLFEVLLHQLLRKSGQQCFGEHGVVLLFNDKIQHFAEFYTLDIAFPLIVA